MNMVLHIILIHYTIMIIYTHIISNIKNMVSLRFRKGQEERKKVSSECNFIN